MKKVRKACVVLLLVTAALGLGACGDGLENQDQQVRRPIFTPI